MTKPGPELKSQAPLTSWPLGHAPQSGPILDPLVLTFSDLPWDLDHHPWWHPNILLSRHSLLTLELSSSSSPIPSPTSLLLNIKWSHDMPTFLGRTGDSASLCALEIVPEGKAS